MNEYYEIVEGEHEDLVKDKQNEFDFFKKRKDKKKSDNRITFGEMLILILLTVMGFLTINPTLSEEFSKWKIQQEKTKVKELRQSNQQ